MPTNTTIERLLPETMPRDLRALAISYRRHLLAENRSPQTIKSYLDSIRIFALFLNGNGMPTNPEEISREHVESFINARPTGPAPPELRGNAHGRRQGLLRLAPRRGRDHPQPDRQGPEAGRRQSPADGAVGRRFDEPLKATIGKDFLSRRDHAMLRFLIDTGVRRSELAGLALDNVDLDMNIASVLGKGNRRRTVAFGRKTAQALDRYLRERARHPYADSPKLWVGNKGGLTPIGVQEMVKRRAAEAGIGRIWPHLFRHTFAHGGSPPAARRATSCGWPAGAHERCSGGTARARLMSGHEPLTSGWE